MKRVTIACLVAATPLAAAGCSASGVPSGPASYLSASNSAVTYIHWRSAPHGHLLGTITERGAGGSAPVQTVSVTRAQFTGTRRDNSVTLTFAPPYFLQSRARGTVNGSVLTIRLAQSDGMVRHMRFIQSGKAGYDRAIATLHSRVRRANLVAAKEHARQRHGPTDAQAEATSQKMLTAIDNASTLASGGMLAGRLARFAHHVHAAQARLAAEKSDASHNNKYCTGAYSAGGAAKAVDGTVQAVQGDAVSLMSDIANIRRDIATARAALHHLRKAGITVPSSASETIASAKMKISQAIGAANSYIDQINAADARARSLADNSSTGRCSGARNGSLAQPVPHIK